MLKALSKPVESKVEPIGPHQHPLEKLHNFLQLIALFEILRQHALSRPHGQGAYLTTTYKESNHFPGIGKRLMEMAVLSQRIQFNLESQCFVMCPSLLLDDAQRNTNWCCSIPVRVHMTDGTEVNTQKDMPGFHDSFQAWADIPKQSVSTQFIQLGEWMLSVGHYHGAAFLNNELTDLLSEGALQNNVLIHHLELIRGFLTSAAFDTLSSPEDTTVLKEKKRCWGALALLFHSHEQLTQKDAKAAETFQAILQTLVIKLAFHTLQKISDSMVKGDESGADTAAGAEAGPIEAPSLTLKWRDEAKKPIGAEDHVEPTLPWTCAEATLRV